MTDWDSKNNKLLITPFDNAIGELFLYDGSLRVALSKDLWEDKKFQKQVKNLITNKINENEKTKVTEGSS